MKIEWENNPKKVKYGYVKLVVVFVGCSIFQFVIFEDIVSQILSNEKPCGKEWYIEVKFPV